MSDEIYSHSSGRLAVCAVPQNSFLTKDDFDLLTFVECANLGALGEYGMETNYSSYDGLDTQVSRKSKGVSNGGEPLVEFARADDDPGQTIMTAAGRSHIHDNFAFRVTRQDGSLDYIRGLVAGPVHPGGRNEDFDLSVYTISVNQVYYHVQAPSNSWLLSSGVWNDSGVWADTAQWAD